MKTEMEYDLVELDADECPTDTKRMGIVAWAKKFCPTFFEIEVQQYGHIWRDGDVPKRSWFKFYGNADSISKDMLLFSLKWKTK